MSDLEKSIGYTDITDSSLSKSASISLSEDSNGSCSPGHLDKNTTQRRRRTRKTKRREVHMSPPEEKLRKCQSCIKAFGSQDDKDQVFSELLRIVPLTRIVFGDSHWRYADAIGKLALGYLDRRLGLQAVKSAEAAKLLILSCDPPSEDEKVDFITCVVKINLIFGKALTSIGERYKDAEDSLLKAWQLLASKHKALNMVTVPIGDGDANLKRDLKMALADLYIVTKQTEKAISSLLFVVSLIQEAYSGSDDFLITVYTKLAQAEKSRKKSDVKYEIIVEHALKAHELCMSCHSLSSLEVADTAFALGKAYASINSEETQRAAETYFTEALAARRLHCTENDARVVEIQDALYKVWMRIGKEDDAVKALKQSISGKIEGFGACSAQLANTYKLIGSVFLSKGDLSSAHKYLTKCLTIETEFYGSQHTKTKSTKSTISLLLQNPGFPKSKQSKLSNRPKFSSTIRVCKR